MRRNVVLLFWAVVFNKGLGELESWMVTKKHSSLVFQSSWPGSCMVQTNLRTRAEGFLC